MDLPRRSGVIVLLLGSLGLSACAAKTPAPAVSMPATVVQAPDPAVIHRVWEAGYNAGYGAAERLENRRFEQEQDEMSNVPAAVIAPAPAQASVPTPFAAAPTPGGFQSTGPATPVSAGD